VFNVCKKVSLLQYVVETVLYGPKKATCKNEVFLVFCFFVPSPISLVLVVIEIPTGVYHLIWVSTFKKKIINVRIKLADGALIPVLLKKTRFVTKLADGVVISSRTQTTFFWGPRCLLSQKSLNNHLGPKFRQPLNKKKYEVTLKIFGAKNCFILKV
jgi:hypothetical protein